MTAVFPESWLFEARPQPRLLCLCGRSGGSQLSGTQRGQHMELRGWIPQPTLFWDWSSAQDLTVFRSSCHQCHRDEGQPWDVGSARSSVPQTWHADGGCSCVEGRAAAGHLVRMETGGEALLAVPHCNEFGPPQAWPGLPVLLSRWARSGSCRELLCNCAFPGRTALSCVWSRHIAGVRMRIRALCSVASSQPCWPCSALPGYSGWCCAGA